MSALLDLVTSSGLGAAAAMLVREGAKWLRARRIKAKVNREARAKGGPEYGTPGWIWREMGGRIDDLRESIGDTLTVQREELSKARSKGHSNEKWCAHNAERIARCEEALFGASRMASGEQERVDFVNDTDPVPAPPMRDEDGPPVRESRADVRRVARRSRP